MSWFLVLLFWNPAIQEFDVKDGWYPMPYATETICDMKADFIRMYVPNAAPDTEVTIDCIQAPDWQTAIAKMKDNL